MKLTTGNYPVIFSLEIVLAIVLNLFMTHHHILDHNKRAVKFKIEVATPSKN